MVISLEATKITPIFAPVIRQVKSGCGRFCLTSMCVV